MIHPRKSALFAAVLLVLSSCGSSDVEPTATAPEPTVAPPASTPDPANVAPEATAGAGGQTNTSVPAVVPPAAGAASPTADWPNRFCVDAVLVETTLNLRAGPSLESAVVASIPRASCELVIDSAHVSENGYEPVRYMVAAGSQDGWVSREFIVLQDPPDRMEAAALLFVEAWQRGYDTGPYSYGIDVLPPPIAQGRPVLVDGTYDDDVQAPDKFGCVFAGDVSLLCAVGLVDDNGTRVAELLLGATQRGANGYEGDDFWPTDFPDRPTITSLRVVADNR